MEKSVFIVVDECSCKKNCEKKFTNNFLHFTKTTAGPIIKNYILETAVKILN